MGLKNRVHRIVDASCRQGGCPILLSFYCAETVIHMGSLGSACKRLSLYFIKVDVKHKILPSKQSQMTSRCPKLYVESQHSPGDFLITAFMGMMLCTHRESSLQRKKYRICKTIMFYKSLLMLWNDGFCFYRFPMEANIIKWEYKQILSHKITPGKW